MDETMYDKCCMCGKTKQLTKVTDRFGFPCLCHSPHHFIVNNLCDDCILKFHTSPDTMCDAVISIETFNTFLKAHVKYALKYNHSFHSDELNPEYRVDEHTGEPSIHIHCTYDMMCYLGIIYTEYIYESTLEEAEKSSDK